MSIQYPNLLLEQTKDLIWLIDHHLNLVYANKAYLALMKEVTGYEKELNTPILMEGFGEGYIEKWKAYYEKAFSGKDFEIEEHFFNPTTGETQFGYITFYPIKNEQGITVNVACRSSDFTPIMKQKNQAGFLMDASLDVFCTINKDGHFKYVSEAAMAHWGYAPTELIGKPFIELVLEEDIAKTNETADAILAGKVVKSFVNRYVRKDGSIAYNSWSARWDTVTKLMYCVARDAKETIEQSMLLQKSEERFRALVQEASDLIAIIDIEGNYSYVSPSTTSILGILPEKLLGKNAFDYIHPDDREKTLPYLQKITTEKTVKVPPFRFQNSKGEWHWIETVLTNMLDNPTIKGIVSNARDVTEKVKEERLRNLLESVITNTHDAVLITEAEPFDEPGPRIIYVNEAFTKMTGYTAEEVIGKTPRILQGPASDKEALAKLGKALRNWEAHEITTINYKKNGEEFWINFTVTPVADKTGWYTHWIAIERDVTEQKNKELENGFISKISLAFNIDHDFQKAADELCKTAGNYGIFDWVELWTLNLEETEMRLLSYYIKDVEKKPGYEESYKLSAIKTGEGFLGRLWKARKSLVIDDIDKADFFLNKDSVTHLGIKSLIGIPLLFNDKVIGVLKLGTKNNPDYLNRLLKISKQLETFIGSEIQRKRIERDLSYLFDAIPDIISLSDLEGKILRINKTGSELLGYTQEEIINEGFEKFIHPDDLEIAYQELNNLGEGKNTFGFEVRFITKSGKPIWLSWYCKSNVKEGLIYATAKNITREKYLSELNKQTRKLARIGSWEVDLIKNEIYWTDEVHEIHETDPASFTPTVASSIQFYKAEFRPSIESYVATAIETGKSFDFEAIIVTARKHERWVRTIGTTEFSNGKCTKIFGSFQDIHEKKMAEEQIAKAYEEKNNILESIGDAFFTVNKNWIVTYWNKQAEKFLDLPKEQIVGKNLWEVFADDIDSQFYRQYQHAIKTGETVRFEEKYPSIGKWFEVNVYPSATGLSIYLTDITLRKEVDERLIEANERFEKVTEATNDAIWDWDIQKNTLYWGNGFKTLFGYDVNKITPSLESWSSHLHPDDKEWVTQSLYDAIESGQNIWIVEYRYKRNNGSFAYVIDRGVVIRDANNKALRMVGAMTDISERKSHEEQLIAINRKLEVQTKELQRSNEELEQFAFITSHDLQEPLRMIASYMDQLKRKYADRLDDKALQYIHFATDGARRMKQIILDLLLYSRANRPDEQKELLNFNEIVLEFLQLRRKLIAEKKASINSSRLPVMETYTAPITQIFHCLLDNALKYAKEEVPPIIDIDVRETTDYWEFTIKDNGIGIDPIFFEKIFIIFQRLHNRNDYGGTGIGLSIAKRSIEFLGGRIWLTSEVDKGTTFYFIIPKTKI